MRDIVHRASGHGQDGLLDLRDGEALQLLKFGMREARFQPPWRQRGRPMVAISWRCANQCRFRGEGRRAILSPKVHLVTGAQDSKPKLPTNEIKGVMELLEGDLKLASEH